MRQRPPPSLSPETDTERLLRPKYLQGANLSKVGIPSQARARLGRRLPRSRKHPHGTQRHDGPAGVGGRYDGGRWRGKAGVGEQDGAGWAPGRRTLGGTEWETTVKPPPRPAASDPPGSAGALSAEPVWAEAGSAAETRRGEARKKGLETAGQPPPAAAGPAAPPCGCRTQLRRSGNKALGGGRGRRGSACWVWGLTDAGCWGGRKRWGSHAVAPGWGLDPGSTHAPLGRNCDSSLGCWR